MELMSSIIKYTFVVALGVEALLVARALFNLARDKAREANLPAPTTAGE
jgi:hypothetical protein